MKEIVVKRKKNIAFIYKTFGIGGIEAVISNLSVFLGKNTNNYLFTLTDEKKAYDFEGEIIDNIPLKEKKYIFTKFIKYIRLILKICKLKKKYNIQTSISFLEYSNLINLLSKQNDRIIISIHSSVLNSNTGILKTIYDFFIRLLYVRADKIIAVSGGVKNLLIKKYHISPSKISVIYNPFNIDKIQIMSKNKLGDIYQSFFNDEVIITVGRVTKHKGQWRLIKALSRLKSDFPNLKVAVLGSGDFEKELKKYTEDLELTEDVLFIPFQENPFQFINKAVLSVLTSEFEGFSNVIVESFACGTPVITTDCQVGPRELLAPNSDLNSTASEIEYADFGVITPFCDSKFEDKQFTGEDNLLVEAIKTMLTDKDLRNRYIKSGYQRAMDFDSVKIIEQYEIILESEVSDD